MYEQVAERYLLDADVAEFMTRSNPWAARAIAERLLEAADRGMWASPEADTLAGIRDRYLALGRRARGGGGVSRPYPLTAIVGQERLIEALLINAVSPEVGGVLVRGERGTAKSTAVRGLAPLLPPVTVARGQAFAFAPGELAPDGPVAAGGEVEQRPATLVELPLGASLDRLVGALDLGRALNGEKAFEAGLLARAHQGILYVDEVNLLPDHLVDALLDAAASGVSRVERDAVSAVHDARFLLVGTMNVEEGELRPQLLDRFGLGVEVTGPAGAGRARRDRPAAPLVRARRRRVRARVAGGRGGARRPHRRSPHAPAARAAAGARAAAHHRSLRQPRRRRRARRHRDRPRRAGAGGARGPARGGGGARPAAPPPWPCCTAAGATRWTAARRRPTTSSARSTTSRRPSRPPAGRRPTAAGGPTRRPPRAARRRRRASAATGRLRRACPPRRCASRAAAAARADAARAARARAPVRSTAGRPGDDSADVSIVATLRARLVQGDSAGLREHVRGGRESVLLCLVVDASGSMGARRRLARVKGALLELLREAYERRDRVAVDLVPGQRRSGARAARRAARRRRRGDPAAADRRPHAAGRRARAGRAGDPPRGRARPRPADDRRDPDRRPRRGSDRRGAAPPRGSAAPPTPRTSIDIEDGPVRLGLAARRSPRPPARAATCSPTHPRCRGRPHDRATDPRAARPPRRRRDRRAAQAGRRRQRRAAAPQAPRPAARDRPHRPRQGQEHVGVRDAPALVGARLSLRRLPVREVGQVEGRRGEGRRRASAASTGRRWATAGRGSRRISRSRPTRRARAGPASSG